MGMTAAASAHVIDDLPDRARAKWHVDEIATAHAIIDGRRIN